MDSIILGFLHGTLSFTKGKVFELCISLRNRGLDMMKILSLILQVGEEILLILFFIVVAVQSASHV